MSNEFDEKPPYKKEHALEAFLDVEPTEIVQVEYEKHDLTEHEFYDGKDSEIENQIEEVFNESMQGYKTLESFLEAIEPKYRARMAEVALQYLKTGLDAANSKAKQKDTKDKINLREALASKGNGKGSNNTVIVAADRNELLKELRKAVQGNDPIDITPEKKDNNDV